MELQSLRLVQTPRLGCFLALLLMGLFVLATVVLIKTPWQQSVKGDGKVTMFDPSRRPQTVEAPIPGRVVEWKVLEGQSVKAGQLLVRLEDLDSKFLDPGQAAALERQRRALLSRQQAARQREASLSRQLDSLQSSQAAALPMAGVRTRQTEERLEAARQAALAAEQSQQTAELNLTRVQDLHDRGLRSTRELELARLEAVRTRTETERAQIAVELAGRDIQSARLDASKIEADTSASLASVEAGLGTVRETLASIEGELSKLSIEQANLKLRNRQQRVVAPVDGRVVRLLKVGVGETVKPGDVLTTIVPETTDQAVELYIAQDDAPLVAPGRPVRVMFAGFPALQFSGWPSAAVGTFAGTVKVVDASDDGSGKYRVLVVPDPGPGEEPWPAPAILRPGAAASGWIMLETVPLYYELWRRWNAFPPNYPVSEGKAPSDPKRRAK